MIKSKKIVLLTSGQPSLNPRIVKETTALLNAGYQVTLIYQYWTAWATKLELPILSDPRLTIFCVGGNPENQKLSYLRSRIRHKLARFLAEKFGFGTRLAKMALGRCTIDLSNKAKEIKADLYIAHNLAALPAAVEAAEKNNAKCGFDAEDFHRFEVSNSADDFDVRLKIFIEDHYLNKLNYLTTASPFISSAYSTLYPKLNPTTILNVFPKQKIIQQSTKAGPLKLFWFSQFIGMGRGLETVIKAICLLKAHPIELHLLGQYDEKAALTWSNILLENGLEKNIIHYHQPIKPDDIYQFAAQFDVGLATEISYPKNRDICLTNKIFTYLQSGLAVIASDTTAQQWLLEQEERFGFIFKKNEEEDLASILANYITDRDLLINHKTIAYQLGFERLNWEMEAPKFLDLIQQQFIS
jgi:glycosyltransferase involved in cell wall biosynthesis